ncbi:MAG: flagellar assembly protein FliX [Alphaproteobacteria bacterium]|nr:flagellar assembly protein FliX [Alphaproteobacteria bacterium]
MRVQHSTLTSKASDLKRRGGVGKGDFSKELSAQMSTSDAEESSAASPAHYINPLLALQEIAPDERGAKREAVDHGQQLLEKLEAVRLALLNGHLTLGQIKELQALLNRTHLAFQDPELESIIADIELRAAVEVAKFEQRRQEKP